MSQFDSNHRDIFLSFLPALIALSEAGPRNAAARGQTREQRLPGLWAGVSGVVALGEALGEALGAESAQTAVCGSAR